MKKLFMFSAVFLCFCASVFFAASDGAVEIALVPAAKAATIVDSGECGAEGDNVTWTLDSDGLLTISGEGEMTNYDPWEDNSAPWQDATFSSAVITDGVTSIGGYAFYEYSNLMSITIPNSVTSIGDWAFCRCRNLPSVTFPDRIKSINGYAFSYCNSLMDVTIPDSVTNIGGSAFCEVPNIVYSGNLSGSPWGARALNGYIEDGLVYEDSSKTAVNDARSILRAAVALDTGKDWLANIK